MAGLLAGMIAITPAHATTTAPAAAARANRTAKGVAAGDARIEKIVKSDQEWKKQLTPEQYRILRERGTEIAFTGKYWNQHSAGLYRCAACGLELFDSSTKFDSGTGWPSFWAPLAKTHVTEIVDRDLGMVRTEARCARCGGHLGHVFDDGPRPTGLRYCINSAALNFEPARK
jgi:peptide-methionine (R)-S-oxide reductase